MAVAGTIFTVQAQSDQFSGAMKQQLGAYRTAAAPGRPQACNRLPILSSVLQEAEKTQWLPYYYAAYCRVNEAFLTQNKSTTDEIIDKAVLSIEKAQTLKGLIPKFPAFFP